MVNQPRTFVLTINKRIPCFDETTAHLNALGLKWEPFYGMDNTICKMTPVDTFDNDRFGERIAPKHICAQLTHYMLWKTMVYLPETTFWVLEYDVEFLPGWEKAYNDAISVLPADWDVVFLGSCCCTGRWTNHIGKNLYDVRYPLCGHAIMYNKKALPVLIETHQKFYAPLDIAMAHDSLPKLNVYTILPAMITQRNTHLPT